MDGARSRSEEESMRDIVDDERRGDRGVHSQPGGLTAARRHLLRCHSSTMSRIAVVVAPRICRLGAVNGAVDFAVTGH
jgi:hypothetical protein